MKTFKDASEIYILLDNEGLKKVSVKEKFTSQEQNPNNYLTIVVSETTSYLVNPKKNYAVGNGCILSTDIYSMYYFLHSDIESTKESIAERQKTLKRLENRLNILTKSECFNILNF